jgi:putative chitinase
MPVDYGHISHAFPNVKPDVLTDFADPLNKTFDTFEINTQNRLSMFLAQIGHESGDFKFLKENLNYSAQGLLGTFPKYFDQDSAAACARQPEKIANIVYAKRMGNGDSESGDGYRFRGRGCIQITGRDNYTAFAKAMDMSLNDAVAYLETIEGACVSAGWFWSTNKLNASADKGDIKANTKKINGGTIGLDDRAARYNRLLSVFKYV